MLWGWLFAFTEKQRKKSMANVNINTTNLILEQNEYWKTRRCKISSNVSHFTPMALPYRPLECHKAFLIFYWNYTGNYTRNYVSPAAIFEKPQVHDPETLTADKKLLGAAVLLTSHLFCTPSALEAIPCSSPPSVSLYDGACTAAGSGLEVQSAAELLIKHPVLHGPLTHSI